MSTRLSRSGGKFGGAHTSVIPASGILADIAVQLTAVTRVSPGFIRSLRGASSGRRTVKFIFESGSLLLSVRENNSSQEIRVFASHLESVRNTLAEEAEKKGIHVLKERGETSHN
ncbi:MAG: DUF2103 domain-containing protein [Patescibacteria group bacterium]